MKHVVWLDTIFLRGSFNISISDGTDWGWWIYNVPDSEEDIVEIVDSGIANVVISSVLYETVLSKALQAYKNNMKESNVLKSKVLST